MQDFFVMIYYQISNQTHIWELIRILSYIFTNRTVKLRMCFTFSPCEYMYFQSMALFFSFSSKETRMSDWHTRFSRKSSICIHEIPWLAWLSRSKLMWGLTCYVQSMCVCVICVQVSRDIHAHIYTKNVHSEKSFSWLELRCKLWQVSLSLSHTRIRALFFRLYLLFYYLNNFLSFFLLFRIVSLCSIDIRTKPIDIRKFSICVIHSVCVNYILILSNGMYIFLLFYTLNEKRRQEDETSSLSFCLSFFLILHIFYYIAKWEKRIRLLYERD